jgi:hypothetical protein
LHRLGVGGEARYHLAYRWFGFVRASAGPTYARALLESRVAQSNWIAKHWLFSAAFSAGTALRLLGAQSGEKRMPRLWVSAEGGYGISSKMPLEFETEDDQASAPERGQVQDLGDLSLNAPFFRLALAGTY